VKASQVSRLARLSVYGFDAAEPVVLAALVTEDPLLLIGPSGTDVPPELSSAGVWSPIP
jgi:MoxR-like ATPase